VRCVYSVPYHEIGLKRRVRPVDVPFMNTVETTGTGDPPVVVGAVPDVPPATAFAFAFVRDRRCLALSHIARWSPTRMNRSGGVFKSRAGRREPRTRLPSRCSRL